MGTQTNRVDFEALLDINKFLSGMRAIEKEVSKTAKKIDSAFTPALEKANKELVTMKSNAEGVATAVKNMATSAKSVATNLKQANRAAVTSQRASTGGLSAAQMRAGINVYGGYGAGGYGPSQINAAGGFSGAPYGPFPRMNAAGGPGGVFGPLRPFGGMNTYGGYGTSGYGPFQSINRYGGPGGVTSPFQFGPAPFSGVPLGPATPTNSGVAPSLPMHGPAVFGQAPGSVKGIFTELIPQIGKAAGEMADMDKIMASLGTRATGFLESMTTSGSTLARTLGQGGLKMGELASAAGLSGKALLAAGAAAAGIAAAVAGAVVAMKGMWEISKMVYQQFIQITDQAAQAAIQIDTARSGFEAMFEGSEDMAGVALDIVREKSREMGADLTQLGRAFLPEMSSLEEFDKLAEVSAALAAYDPAQGAYGVNLALKDAMTGDFRSLRQRLEFSVPETDRIRAHMEENGNSIISMLDAIEVELERKGRSWEAFADTFAVQIGRVQQGWQFLLEEMGEPILDTQKEGFRALADAMEENMDVFIVMGQGVGRLRAIIEDLKLSFYQGLVEVIVSNQEQIFAYLEYAEKMFTIIATVAREAGQAIQSMFTRSESNDATAMRLVLDQIIQMGRAVAVKFIEASTIVENFFETFRDNVDALATILDPDSTAEERWDALANLEGPSDLVKESLDEAKASIEELDNSLAQLEVDWETRMENIGKSADDTAEQIANAFLEVKAAQQVLAQAQADLAEAQADFDSDLIELTRDTTNKILESWVQHGRDIIDLERDTSQKREDAMRDHIQTIRDMQIDYRNDLQDAAMDYAQDQEDAALKAARKEEDIRREYARKLLEDEEDLNKKKLEAERKYRDKLAELRRKYEFDAAEAIRQNDAVALLRLKRKLQFDLNEARIARDKEQSDEDRVAAEKKAQRERDLQDELEDARIANERRLEDAKISYERELEQLQINLQRKLAEHQLALERELEAIKTAEERKREEINLAHNRRIEDLITNLDREARVLNEKMDAQVRIVEAAAKRMQNAYARMTAVSSRGILVRTGVSSSLSGRAGNEGGPLVGEAGSGLSGGRGTIIPGADGGYVDTTDSTYRSKALGGRRWGGSVFPGMPVVVGEPRAGNTPNPEIFIPSQLGRIMPYAGAQRYIGDSILGQWSLMNRPPIMGYGGGNNYQSVTEMNIDLSENIMDKFSPVQMRIMENVFTQLMINARRRQGTFMRRT